LRGIYAGMRVKEPEDVGGEGEAPQPVGRRGPRFARGTAETLAQLSWHDALDLQSASDPVFVVDQGQIVAVNALAEALVGAQKDELIGAPLATVMRATRDSRPFTTTGAGVRFIGRDRGIEVLQRDGTTLPVELIVCATKPGASLVVVRNAAAGSVREEDMAEIVHDLKNPLSTIAIDAQVLSYRSDSGATPSQVWRIERNVAYMDRLVHELLDLCALDSGRFNLERRPIELRSLIERVLDRTLPTHHRARVYLDAFDHVVVPCDEYRIERVVANLVENAIKYTPPSTDIIVRMRTRYPIANVSVIDSGPGLSPAECELVFDKFKRAATSRSGSGLGLYVSRKIIDAHGGRLAVESVPGVGSRFFFELPVSRRGGSAVEQ
jgi:PAS domain S-box-containing protein